MIFLLIISVREEQYKNKYEDLSKIFDEECLENVKLEEVINNNNDYIWELQKQNIDANKKLDYNFSQMLEIIEPLKETDSYEYYELYKKITEYYTGCYDFQAMIEDNYSEEDLNYLARCVETECYQCQFNCKVNVANVIINRVNSDRFKQSTIKDVITSPNQFAYHRTNISEDTILAIEYTLLFGDTTEGALFFHSNNKTQTFNGADYIFTDECGHHFYK